MVSRMRRQGPVVTAIEQPCGGVTVAARAGPRPIRQVVLPRNYLRPLGLHFTTRHSPVWGSRWLRKGLLLRGLLQGVAMALIHFTCTYGKK